MKDLAIFKVSREDGVETMIPNTELLDIKVQIVCILKKHGMLDCWYTQDFRIGCEGFPELCPVGVWGTPTALVGLRLGSALKSLPIPFEGDTDFIVQGLGVNPELGVNRLPWQPTPEGTLDVLRILMDRLDLEPLPNRD